MAQVEKFYLPDELHYDSEEHLWVKVENGVARVGMDQLGQESAGTIVHISIPASNKQFHKKDGFGFLAAGKFVGPMKIPINGRIVTINYKVLAKPELINQDPYGEGWLIIVRPEHLEEDLLSLLHGDEVVTGWLRTKIQNYRERGILPEHQTGKF